MASVRQKQKRLEATIQKVDDFVAAGGDLKIASSKPRVDEPNGCIRESRGGIRI